MDVWTKSETVDPEVRAYVYSLVNAVGGRSTLDESYAIGDDALATLKDIRRWLLLYDEKTNRLDVKRVLAEANLVKGDLLEILAAWKDDAPEEGLRSKLALACLELLVPLTWPLELSEDKASLNTHRHLPYLQLAQVDYKRAILHHEGAPILRKVMRIALPCMAKPRSERSKRDEGTIMLMMFLLKHVVMINQPQYLPSQGDENDISRAAVIDAFHAQDVFSLLLTLGSGISDGYQDHDVEMLEILYHLLQGISPRKLFMRKEQVTSSDMLEFKELLNKEDALLSSFKKTAPTRHNRFGTMIWVKRDGQKLSTVSGQSTITSNGTVLQQMDTSKKWNRPKFKGRVAKEAEEQTTLETSVDLPDSSRAHLRAFIEDFLDSSFNPLFSSLRKAIERELDRVKDSNIKQYFFLMQWFLAADAARKSQVSDTADASAENQFAYIAAVLDQETFVLLNRSMQRATDEKDWRTLQSTLAAFTQILLTTQRMSESQSEEDQEIAENILNRIFYEEATHDRIATALRNYKQQGFVYLDCITECVHVFIRLLEQYSKHNVDMHIRSKRRARRKAQRANPSTADENADQEDAAEDEREAYRAVNERKFDFSRFVTKFLNQSAVNTFTEFMQYHAEMSAEQLKRCHRYFYRLAFKVERAVLLFRVDTLFLFHKLIRGPGGLPRSSSMYGDWETLIRQVFRKCVKWLSKETDGQGWREMCVVEMLFSKIPSTMFYLDNGYEVVVEKKAPRPPAALDFKAIVEDSQKIGIAVSIVLDKVKGDELRWIKEQLQKAIEERQAWQDAEAARLALVEPAVVETEEQSDPPQPPMIVLSPGSEERKLSLFKDKHLRLLMSTIGFDRLGIAEDVDAQWFVPSSLSVDQLKASLEQVQKAEFDPPSFDDGKSALDMIRNKTTILPRTSDDAPGFIEDDSEIGSNDEAMFPPNMREKRKRTADGAEPKKRRRLTKRDDEDESLSDIERRAELRRQREREKSAKIKSKLFITESDEESDAEADAEFFRLEEERRQKMRGVISNALLTQTTKEKGRMNTKRVEEEPDSDEGSASDDTVDEAVPAVQSRRPLFEALSSDESDLEDIDGSADETTQGNDASSSTSVDAAHASALKTISNNIRIATREDDDDELPVMKQPTRLATRRAGFVLDDSDSE
ncbi:hypothetical protein AMS68_000675 [Peltaster fructicola]|uniref:Topoisomerase 1-associated factor 1 n=1 Tax=Peltaster fructicola TaxID=286661 RepID=A0A6H0XKJ8_9PEZI|nr:hypothetical protein AMS68_000675 [Peltaster fructicola]